MTDVQRQSLMVFVLIELQYDECWVSKCWLAAGSRGAGWVLIWRFLDRVGTIQLKQSSRIFFIGMPWFDWGIRIFSQSNRIGRKPPSRIWHQSRLPHSGIIPRYDWGFLPRTITVQHIQTMIKPQNRLNKMNITTFQMTESVDRVCFCVLELALVLVCWCVCLFAWVDLHLWPDTSNLHGINYAWKLLMFNWTETMQMLSDGKFMDYLTIVVIQRAHASKWKLNWNSKSNVAAFRQ